MLGRDEKKATWESKLLEVENNIEIKSKCKACIPNNKHLCRDIVLALLTGGKRK